MTKKRQPNFDEDGFPNRAGVYEVKEEVNVNNHLIQVYQYNPKGLCCFKDDFGSSGSGVDDKHDDHLSVQFTGLTFPRRIANLNDPKFTYLT